MVEGRPMSGEGSRRTRVRAAHRLSAIKVSRIKKPALYEDGGGLRLVITVDRRGTFAPDRRAIETPVVDGVERVGDRSCGA